MQKRNKNLTKIKDCCIMFSSHFRVLASHRIFLISIVIDLVTQKSIEKNCDDLKIDCW